MNKKLKNSRKAIPTKLANITKSYGTLKNAGNNDVLMNKQQC